MYPKLRRGRQLQQSTQPNESEADESPGSPNSYFGQQTGLTSSNSVPHKIRLVGNEQELESAKRSKSFKESNASPEPVDVTQFFEDMETPLIDQEVESETDNESYATGRESQSTATSTSKRSSRNMRKRRLRLHPVGSFQEQQTMGNQVSEKNSVQFTLPEEDIDRLLNLSSMAITFITPQKHVHQTDQRRNSHFAFEEIESNTTEAEIDRAYSFNIEEASCQSIRARVALRILEYVFDKVRDYQKVLQLVLLSLEKALHRSKEECVYVPPPSTVSVPDCYDVYEETEQQATLNTTRIPNLISDIVTIMNENPTEHEGEIVSEAERHRWWANKLQEKLQSLDIVKRHDGPSLSIGELSEMAMDEISTDNIGVNKETVYLEMVMKKYSLLKENLERENKRLKIFNSRVQRIVEAISLRWRNTIIGQCFRTWRENAVQHKNQLRKIHGILLRASRTRLKKYSFYGWSRHVKRVRWKRIEEESKRLTQSVENLTTDRDRLAKQVRDLEQSKKTALKKRQNLQTAIAEVGQELKSKNEELNDHTEFQLRSAIRSWIRVADTTFEASVKSCAINLEALSGPLPEYAPAPGGNEHPSLSVADCVSGSVGFGEFGKGKSLREERSQTPDDGRADGSVEGSTSNDKNRKNNFSSQSNPGLFEDNAEVKGFRFDIGRDQGFERQYIVNPILLLTPSEISAIKARCGEDEGSDMKSVAQRNALVDLPHFEKECLKTLVALPFDVLLLRWVNFHTQNGNLGLWRDWWRLWYREVTAPKAEASYGVRDLRKKVKKQQRRSTKTISRRRSMLARKMSQFSNQESQQQPDRKRSMASASSMSGKSNQAVQSGVDYQGHGMSTLKALVETTVPHPTDSSMEQGSHIPLGYERFGDLIDSATERRLSKRGKASRRPLEHLEFRQGDVHLNPECRKDETLSEDTDSGLLDIHIWSFGALNSISTDSWSLQPLREKFALAAGETSPKNDPEPRGEVVAGSKSNSWDPSSKELIQQTVDESDWRGPTLQIENFGDSLSGGDAYALLLHRITTSNSFSMTQLSSCRQLLNPCENLDNEAPPNPAAVDWYFCKKKDSRKGKSTSNVVDQYVLVNNEEDNEGIQQALTAMSRDGSYLVLMDESILSARLQVPSVLPISVRERRKSSAASSVASGIEDFQNTMKEARKRQRQNASIVPHPHALPIFPASLSQVDDAGRARELIDIFQKIGCPREMVKPEHIMQSENYTVRNLLTVSYLMTRWPELRSPDGWCTFSKDSAEENVSRATSNLPKQDIHITLFSGRRVGALLPFDKITSGAEWDLDEEKTRLRNRVSNAMAIGDDVMLAHPCTLKRAMEVLARLRIEWRTFVTAAMISTAPVDRTDEVLQRHPDEDEIHEFSTLPQSPHEFDAHYLEHAHEIAERWRTNVTQATVDHPWYNSHNRERFVDARVATLAADGVQYLVDAANRAITARRVRCSMWMRLRDHIQTASWNLLRSLSASASQGPGASTVNNTDEEKKLHFTDERDGLAIVDRRAVRVYHAYAIAPLSMLNSTAPSYMFLANTEWLDPDVTSTKFQLATRLTLDYTIEGTVVAKVMNKDPEKVRNKLVDQGILFSSGLPSDTNQLRDFGKGVSRAAALLISTISHQLRKWQKLTQQVFSHYAAKNEGDSQGMQWREFFAFAKECRLTRRDEEEERVKESLRRKKKKGPIAPIRQGGGAGMGKVSVLVSTGGKSTLVQRPSSADDFKKVPKSGLTRKELRACFIASVADHERRDQLLTVEAANNDAFWEPNAELGPSEFVSLLVRTAIKYFRRERVVERSRSRIEEERKKRDREGQMKKHENQHVQAGGLAIAAKLREGQMTSDDFLQLKRERPDLFTAVRRGDYGMDLKHTADAIIEQSKRKSVKLSRQSNSSSVPVSKSKNEPSLQANDDTDDNSNLAGFTKESWEKQQEPKLAQNGTSEKSPLAPITDNREASPKEESEPDTMQDNEGQSSFGGFTSDKQRHESGFSFTPDSATRPTSSSAESGQSEDHSEKKGAPSAETTNGSALRPLSMEEAEHANSEYNREEFPDPDESDQVSVDQPSKKMVTFEEAPPPQQARRESIDSTASGNNLQTSDAYEHDYNGDKVHFGKFYFYSDSSVENHIFENLEKIAESDSPKSDLMPFTIHPTVAYEALMKWFISRYACRSQRTEWHQQLRKPAMRGVFRKHSTRIQNLYHSYVQRRAYRLKKTLKKSRPNEITPREVDAAIKTGAASMTLADLVDFLRSGGLLLSKKKKKKQAKVLSDPATIKGALSDSPLEYCQLYDIRGVLRRSSSLRGLDILAVIMKVMDSNRLTSSGDYVYNVDVELLFDPRKIFQLKQFRKMIQREGIEKVDGVRMFQYVPMLMRIDKDLAHAVLAPDELPLWRLSRTHRQSYYYLVNDEPAESGEQQSKEGENKGAPVDMDDGGFKFEEPEDEEPSSEEEEKPEEEEENTKKKKKKKKKKKDEEEIPPPPSVDLEEQLSYSELLELLPALAAIYDPRPHLPIEKKTNYFINRYVPAEMRMKKGKIKRQSSKSGKDLASAAKKAQEEIEQEENTLEGIQDSSAAPESEVTQEANQNVGQEESTEAEEGVV